MAPTPPVATGLDLLPEHPAARLLRGRRVAALVHHASVDRELRHAAPILSERVGAQLVTLFGPEHGVWSTHQDMEAVPGGRDPWLGLPVHSLYGDSVDSLAPEPGSLDGVDAVFADLMDVGARYYTYVATVVAMARACARRGLPLVVADRPNPIGGVKVEGAPVRPGFKSFVSAMPVPHRHGRTLGELVSMAADDEELDLDLHVLGPAGWTREHMTPETGVPWVPPSPNMPTFEAALVYPGMCLLEGTTLSEGRGTTTPFLLFGAPGVDPFALARELGARDLPGVAFRPHVFRPMFQKHAGELCGGAQVVVTDPGRVDSLALGAHVLHAVRVLHPEVFGWRREAYEFVTDIPAVDLLCGDPSLREVLDAGGDLSDLLAEWRAEARGWEEANPLLDAEAEA